MKRTDHCVPDFGAPVTGPPPTPYPSLADPSPDYPDLPDCLRRSVTKRKPSRKPTPFEPVCRSIYIGRLCFGRYVQTEKKRFEVFAAYGLRPISVCASAPAALAAIKKAARS